MTRKELFDQQGYLVLPGAIDGEHIQSLRDAAARIVDQFDIEQHRSIFSTGDRDRGRDRYFMDSSEGVHCFLEEEALDESGNLCVPKDRAINKIGHAMHDLDPAFTAFCRLPVFADLLEELGYRRPVLWQSMYIFKQPRIGGEVRWHQDASYLHSKSSPVLGIWVALEDATRENGCLWVHPGGHRSPLRDIYEVDPETRVGELTTVDDTPWPPLAEAQCLEVSAGSVVAFSDRMPHYSSANRSSRSRQAFTMHFSEDDADWSPLNWLQRPNLGHFYV